MTDRELLELAAKAFGIQLLQWNNDNNGWLVETVDGSPRYFWNPLTDDGDALRLAVKLKMSFSFLHTPDYIVYAPGGMISDKCPRRAIVRAAAAIAKESP